MTKITEKQSSSIKDASKKKISGVVMSDKMDKTVVVMVNTLKTHKKYLKKYLSTKKYKVHDENNVKKVGDKIDFIACRPVSGGKKFTVVK
ncbi:MAG: 30S ribosomal protein S17 [Candidatus Moranbacteria bacterium GW2011_GWE2_35_2-]|nr:MAG: 30S ribosomal protein S17 [Candidatus Moranbacteria bacterium GW2011_GWE2_35_2-]KKQ04918.1 MAG: 30S ribosomal protein S17 [Candidatus Moranbacteria bacterium GW2011_GWF1_36_4]KKQ22922.1 MAG: 30S ribosomal protein S17 [Candidatus Moranbacteria bacterium GW2011_GWF2_37_11]KKQ29280.1 MAG: 30S ribosomal protein S17 [Candidatus Moranbacteria bacterium GW2011_GWD1_37_17]KKQ30847.1 MAG: 30S ribosomal protein S17 [Candidatus Moranbacteria bacterium GW2011_GWE1_37_24]KKQ47950.1 MAG: 30S ribosom